MHRRGLLLLTSYQEKTYQHHQDEVPGDYQNAKPGGETAAGQTLLGAEAQNFTVWNSEVKLTDYRVKIKPASRVPGENVPSVDIADWWIIVLFSALFAGTWFPTWMPPDVPREEACPMGGKHTWPVRDLTLACLSPPELLKWPQSLRPANGRGLCLLRGSLVAAGYF
nr:hypothetical protein Iba_chr02aCG12930 [Ipomoea batatas]